MPIAIPYWQMAPNVVQGVQSRLADGQTPEQKALTAQLQQTPEYQQLQRDLANGFRLGNSPALTALNARAKALGLPEDSVLDPTGVVRSKSWIEAHPVLYAALVTGGALGGAAAIPALAGAAGGGAASPAATYGPLADGYAGLGTVGATSGAGAAAVVPPTALTVAGPGAGAVASWLKPQLWQAGLNAAGTYLDTRGRQQAAETMAGAARDAADYTKGQTEKAAQFALQSQANSAPWLQNPRGQQMPTLAQLGGLSFAPGGHAGFNERIGSDGSPAPSVTLQRGDPMAQQGQGGDWITQALQAAKSTDDPAYWQRVTANDPNLRSPDPAQAESAKQYWLMRIAKGDGAEAVRNGTEQRYGAGFSDPNHGRQLGAQPPSLAQLGGMNQPMFSAPQVNPFMTAAPPVYRPMPSLAQMMPPAPVPYVMPTGRR